MKRHILLLLLSLIFSFSHAQLKINEIMTNNVSAVMDQYYNYSMWVELYNPTNGLVNQSLYFFTDDLNEPRKWQPPAMYIAAKGYNLLWFERPDYSGHSKFRLNPNGGRLFLLNQAGAIIDVVTYPKQHRNVSYGRKTDGSDEWVFFEGYSPRASNNGNKWAMTACEKPRLTQAGGLYPSSITVKFETPPSGDTIYYNLSSEEPNRKSIRYIPGVSLPITSTRVIRAISYGANRLPSEITTASYFINQRDFNLPLVSIVSSQANLTDNTIGIYTRGTNGIVGNGETTPANWNQDWDRPANFELIDTTNVVRVNQELDIQIAGGWTRSNPQKSLHIKPKQKYNGNNKIDYNVFAAHKPNNSYKDISLRNSGNDFYYSMMRDGFMQSLIIGRMDMDYLAYEPAVCFMNGIYYGIQNLRERSNADWVYANYGYDEEEIIILDQLQIASSPYYKPLIDLVTNNDITQDAIYQQAAQMMDVDNFINYMIAQIYYGNYDWPHNNIKMWKKKEGGKWRWILFDTDFGFNLYEGNLHTFNALTYALGESSSKSTQAWATALIKRLILNPTFRNKFVDRFAIHLSSTFETNRVNSVMDSIAGKIRAEIGYHKSKWSSWRDFNGDIGTMKTFSANRPNAVLGHLSSRFMSGATIQTAQITSNIPSANYTMNGELIIDADINLRGFKGRTLQITANELKGYDFKHWELVNAITSSTLIPYDSDWKYWDLSGMPATNWYSSSYNDGNWKNGPAPLGYKTSDSSVSFGTTVGYGGNTQNVYPTSYFRKTFQVEKAADITTATLTVFVDDGAAVYLNGTELGRYNMPAGELSFNTYSTTYNNGEYASFDVPVSLLKEGDNLVAVEVHQTNATSSDLVFNLQLVCESYSNSTVSTNPTYTTNLTANVQLRSIYVENNEVDPVETATVVINEIVSSNNTIEDEYGDTDDYIELYNYGETEQNVAGWYLTDRNNNLTLSRIPSTDSAATRIPAKGFLLIWADGTPAQGVLHSNFSLSQQGETVALSAEDKFGKLHVLDQVSFPVMQQNLSFSRMPDGGSVWEIQAPTPGMSNLLSSDSLNEDDKIRVFPTMVTNSVYVEHAMNKTIRITDLTGKLIYEAFNTQSVTSIDMSQLQKGIYLIQINGKAFKVIKR